jgi:hypothetical protein
LFHKGAFVRLFTVSTKTIALHKDLAYICETMRKIHFHLFSALLTFVIGIGFSSLWFSFNSVDRKLASALQIVHMERAQTATWGLKPKELKSWRENELSKYVDKLVADDVENLNKGCSADNLSVADCTARKEAAIKDIEETILTTNNLK